MNDSVLVVINQIHPIYVTFAVPEQDLAEVKRYQARDPLAVEAPIPNDPRPPAVGQLAFIDNAVDTATGTIKMRATFPNIDNRLWPGQFVNVVIRLTTQANATVVPSQSVQTGQVGKYVFVVKPDETADLRPVVAGGTLHGETVIEKGVTPGETVVTDGQLLLAPGSKVQIKKGT
jgi:multidrug efflux system membrane fusion protein